MNTSNHKNCFREGIAIRIISPMEECYFQFCCRLSSATLLKVIPLQACFSCFLNCTKSRSASHVFPIEFWSRNCSLSPIPATNKLTNRQINNSIRFRNVDVMIQFKVWCDSKPKKFLILLDSTISNPSELPIGKK